MISAFGSSRNARISGVMVTTWPPRLSTGASRRAGCRARSAAPASSSRSGPSSDVVAHAEEGEIVGGQPFQELDRLGDLVDRQRRRIGLQLGDHLGDAAEHRPPVLHALPDLGEHVLQRLHHFGAAMGVVDAVDVDVDEALAHACWLRWACSGMPMSRPAWSRVDRQDRMRHQPDDEAALGQLAHHRIDQERHVVVDDLEHRDGLQPLARQRRRRLEADLRRARLALARNAQASLASAASSWGW